MNIQVVHNVGLALICCEMLFASPSLVAQEQHDAAAVGAGPTERTIVEAKASATSQHFAESGASKTGLHVDANAASTSTVHLADDAASATAIHENAENTSSAVAESGDFASGDFAGDDFADGDIESAGADDFADLDLGALLDVKVVSSTKDARSLETAPSIMTVYTRRDMDRLGVSQLIDLLRLTPGFVEVSAPMERNIATRGIHASTSQNILVMINGLSMNNVITNTAGPDSFLLDMAERVEIIRGPGAALYGSNALTAVVNIIMRDPKNAPTFAAKLAPGTNLSATLDLQGSKVFDNGVGFYLDASVLTSGGSSARVPGGEDVLISRLGQNSSDGLQNGENLSRPAGLTPVRVNAYDSVYNVTMNLQVPNLGWMTIFLGQNDYSPQRTSQQGLVNMDRQSLRTQSSRARRGGEVGRIFGDMDEWGQYTVRLSLMGFRQQQVSQWMNELDYDLAGLEHRPVSLDWEGDDYRARLALDYAINWDHLSFIDRLSLRSGVELSYNISTNYQITECRPDPDHVYGPSSIDNAEHDYICMRGSALIDEDKAVDKWGNVLEKQHTTWFGDGDDLNVGSYAQLNADLPYEINALLAGRLDYNPEYAPVFSPRFALVKGFKPLYFKLLYGSSFVYPPFLYRSGNRQAGIIGNPEMQPQSMNTAEILAGLRAGVVRFELNGYLNYVHDFITFDAKRLAETGMYFYDNYGDIYVAGTEATLTHTLLHGRLTGHLGAGVNIPLDWTDDIFLVDGKLAGPSKYPHLQASAIINIIPLDHFNVNLSAIYHSAIPWTLNPNLHFTDIQSRDAGLLNSSAVDAYDTSLLSFNANLTYRLFKYWQVGLRVSNMFNSIYRLPGATSVPYVTEGRQAFVSLAYTN